MPQTWERNASSAPVILILRCVLFFVIASVVSWSLLARDGHEIANLVVYFAHFLQMLTCFAFSNYQQWQIKTRTRMITYRRYFWHSNTSLSALDLFAWPGGISLVASLRSWYDERRADDAAAVEAAAQAAAATAAQQAQAAQDSLQEREMKLALQAKGGRVLYFFLPG